MAPRGPDVRPAQRGPARTAGWRTVPPSVFVIGAGVWLIVAPFALQYDEMPDGSGARWNDIVIGVAVTFIGLIRAVAPYQTRSLSAVTLVLAAWLIAAPFVLGYGDAGDAVRAIWNDLASGVLLLLFAAVSWLVSHPTKASGSRTL